MGAKAKTNASTFFWKIAGELLNQPDVSEGTLMGFPCLRVGGGFFATCDHRSGDLIVKLPSARVHDVIATGRGQPFAPAGRVFTEWVLVQVRDAREWKALMDESIAFVRG